MSEWAEKAELRCACGGPTAVVNTRGRAKHDVIYRQRQCKSCGETFSTLETRDTIDQLDRARQEFLDAMQKCARYLQDALRG